jgi:hypothetical protein
MAEATAHNHSQAHIIPARSIKYFKRPSRSLAKTHSETLVQIQPGPLSFHMAR